MFTKWDRHKRKVIYLVILNLCIFSVSYCQTTITGIVKDVNNNPIPYANIHLLSSHDSVELKSTTSSDQGIFTFTNIAKGNYILLISTINYHLEYINLITTSFKVQLGVINLKRKINNLSEVAISAKKPLYVQKIDRLVVNVQNNLTFSGGTALEILKHSPGVDVSPQNHSISLNGNSNVLLMINGRYSKMPVSGVIQLLNGLPASNIKQIELIANPGAKYDAGSSGGIINIILLKEEKKGTNGSLSLTGGVGGKERAGVTLHINHSLKKINIYSFLAYYRNHNDQTYKIRRNIFKDSNLLGNYLYSDRDPLSNYYTGKIGIDYKTNNKITFGGSISGFADRFHLSALTNDKIDSFETNSSIVINNTERNIWSNLTGNIYFNKKINKRNNINLDFTYLYYYNSNRLKYINNYFDEQNNYTKKENMMGNKVGNIKSLVGTIDYVYNIKEKSKLKFGLKSSLSRFYANIIDQLTNNGIVSIDSNLTEIFRLSENINAVYSSFDSWLNNKTELIIGLRYENFKLRTESQNLIIKRSSGDFFPSIFLSRKIDDKNTLQLSYAKRVSRPSYNDFAPYFIFIDPSTSFTGNQALTQSISNIFKIDYKYKTAFISVQYSHANNAIVRFQPQVDTTKNQLFYSSINLKYENTIAVIISIPIKISSWWNMQNNILGVRKILRTNSKVYNLNLTNNYLKIKSTQSFNLPSNFSIELSAYYNSYKLLGISKDKPYGNINLGVEKKFKDWSKLAISINNIIRGSKEIEIINDQRLNFNYLAEYHYSPTIFRITYTHNFGSKNPKLNIRKSAGAKDIEGRIR